MNHHISAAIEILEARIAPAVIFAVDDSNHLISFDSATPGTIIATKNIVGLTDANNEKIKGIDFRPANGKLYALGVNVIAGADNDEGRLYTVNFSGTDAVLTQVGNTPFFSTFETQADFAFDFNPAADRLRVATDGDKNLRVNPNTGGFVQSDTAITPGSTQIIGLAYDRNFDGTPLTTLYGIDNNTNSLVTIGGIDGNPSPNGGVINSIGALGVSVDNFKTGFDIESRTGTAFAVMHVGTTKLYSINLLTGAANEVGAVAGNPQLNGMTIALPDDLTIVNGTTATYIDQDGDRVTVKMTGAAPGAQFSPEDFSFSTGKFGSQLKLLDLSAASNAQEWTKASLTITAVPVGTKGDSFATVGYINATGVDLGKVSVNGDLGQIDAGDATTTTPGLLGLTVQSMGVFGNSQLPSSALVPNQISDIVGKLGALTVKSDFTREQINVTGGATDGAIGPITIGGDFVGLGALASSGINSTGPMGAIKIGGSLYGGSATNVGSIIAQVNSSIGAITIGGSIYGGSATNAGIIEGSNIGNVLIKGSVFGGTDDHTGTIHAKAIMGTVTVLGSIVGGNVAATGDLDSGLIYTTGAKMGNVKILGNLQGTLGDFSGSVFSSGTIGTVTIGGYLKGGGGSQSGNIEAGNGIGAVKILGDAIGGAGDYSGSVYTYGTGNITSVTVLGSVTGNGNTLTGIISGNQLGAVKIGGSLEAGAAAGVRISALGKTNGTTVADAKAVGAMTTVTITGSVKNALILGGYGTNGTASNPDATIGAINIGGNFIGSSILAGTTTGADPVFGTNDFAKIAEAVDPLFSKIAAVTIKGYVAGTFGGTDKFGIVAEQIGVVKVGLRAHILATGTDLTGFSLGPTNDVHFREV